MSIFRANIIIMVYTWIILSQGRGICRFHVILFNSKRYMFYDFDDFTFFRFERKYYYMKRNKSKSSPSEYLSFIIDGMDQCKSRMLCFAFYEH